MLLASVLPNPDDRARLAFNAASARQVDDFRDFIRLHYVSERRDSPFWRDVAASHPQVVRDRLLQWQDHIPRAADFARFPPGLEHLGLAHVEEQLYVPVMDGKVLMGVVSFMDVAKAVLEEQGFENRMRLITIS